MSKQLERLAEFEREKEQREARYYKQAQQNVNQQKQKLTSLEQSVSPLTDWVKLMPTRELPPRVLL